MSIFKKVEQCTEIPSLASLDECPYLDDRGQIEASWQGQIGAYAIFDRDRHLQFVGYSRDIYASLVQHLVRQPEKCYWLKVNAIARPSRTILDATRSAWIAENGSIPPGNDSENALWTQAIDAKGAMTQAEKETYAASEAIAQAKLLKQVARRVETRIMEAVNARGGNLEIRFHPKLKEQGLLDVQSVQSAKE